MITKCTEEQFNICTNSAFCHLCDGKRLFKKPKWMILKEKADARKQDRYVKQKKQGMEFEKDVQKIYNKKNIRSNAGNQQSSVAYRQPNSGGLWHSPGDIITPQELMECKERGTKTSKGIQTITIQKLQLDKIQEEAILANKEQWYYVFRFKDSKQIFVVKDFEDELELIELLNQYKEQLEDKDEITGKD